ncbi:MAG: TetR/AcrR family transcriptional regulator [Clostridia bacterium]|nr:TetR/AcrR family transcriptional regulator [Clostridia bacterium]
MKQFDSVKEKILDRTLYLIGKTGRMNVSVREIAMEAGVNVAAINYHFRTKELMLKEVERLFIDNYNQVFSILDDEKYSAEEKLEKLLNEIIEYTLHYPGITALINRKMADSSSDMGKHLSLYVKENSRKTQSLINEILENPEGKAAVYYETVLIASVVYPASVNQNTSFYNQIELEDKDTRIKYVKHLIKMMKGRENE